MCRQFVLVMSFWHHSVFLCPIFQHWKSFCYEQLNFHLIIFFFGFFVFAFRILKTKLGGDGFVAAAHNIFNWRYLFKNFWSICPIAPRGILMSITHVVCYLCFVLVWNQFFIKTQHGSHGQFYSIGVTRITRGRGSTLQTAPIPPMKIFSTTKSWILWMWTLMWIQT